MLTTHRTSGDEQLVLEFTIDVVSARSFFLSFFGFFLWFPGEGKAGDLVF